MKIVPAPSPNFGTRPCPVDAVVLHATADSDTHESVVWCRTPKPKNPNPVSYHAIIDRDGTVFDLVDTGKRAWHAGVSSFTGRQNVNDFSIGYSFGNRNDGVEPYPEIQLQVGAALCAAAMKRYGIPLDRITTHANIAPGRKTDPAPPAFNLDAFKLRVLREVTGAGGCI